MLSGLSKTTVDIGGEIIWNMKHRTNYSRKVIKNKVRTQEPDLGLTKSVDIERENIWKKKQRKNRRILTTILG